VRIRRYVEKGGVFVGFCAGGYYAAAKCEFMRGDPVMEVVGERELGFFPGVCRGLAFKGFRYQSEQGARAAKISVREGAFQGLDTAGEVPAGPFAAYYNGGGVFVDAEKFRSDGVEVLADYEDKVDLDDGKHKATVVYRPVGKGRVLLTGLHPECVQSFARSGLSDYRFDPSLLEKNKHGERYTKAVEELEKDDSQRRAFLKACFVKLGLQVNPNPQPVPSLSPLHLSSSSPHDVSSLLPKWESILTRSRSGQVTLAGDSNKFHLRNVPNSYAPEHDLDLSSLSMTEKEVDDVSGSEVDYDKIAKHIILHLDGRPSLKETPAFNHALFYDSLERSMSYRRDYTFGKYILYGEVVTSTSTMLEKSVPPNPSLFHLTL
jgi:biotin--protein ligase